MSAPSFELETPRLRLRAWRDGDIDAYAAIVADPEVMRYMGTGPLSREQAAANAASFAARAEARPGVHHHAAELKATGELVGRIGLLHQPAWPGPDDTDLGWLLGREHWGKGYATEGARAHVEHAFAALGLPRVIAFTLPENTRSAPRRRARPRGLPRPAASGDGPRRRRAVDRAGRRAGAPPWLLVAHDRFADRHLRRGGPPALRGGRQSRLTSPPGAVGARARHTLRETVPDLAEQRRSLPDEPGVYLFRDARGRVLYVGKAKSIRKRVASHFSNPSTKAGRDLLPLIEAIDTLVVETDAEALLSEQEFIRRYKPRFNVRLRDDKSYPYIGISLDEDFPRVYFTRERHRRERAYFGPYSNAGRVRQTLDLLGKIFLFRSCEGPEPGRRSGSPCLDYYIKRCKAPCVGYATREEYREDIGGVIDFLSGRYRAIERTIEAGMRRAAAEQRFEDAARERNRLTAIRHLLERQRVANEAVGTVDAVAIALDGTEANAQVFQVRDGVLADRQSFYLDNETGRDLFEVAEAFLLQFYGSSSLTIPPQIVVQRGVANPTLQEALAARRGGPVELREAERGDKRRILDLAERNARLQLDQEKLKSERRRQTRVEALDGLQRALGLDTVPLRIECFDISTLMGTNTVASMVVFEGGAPKKSDYRRFKVRGNEEGVPDDFAAMREVLGRRYARYAAAEDVSEHDASRDASFAALPGVIVIDGGKGQLAAGLDALGPFRARGVTVISLAKRIEEVFIPGRARPLLLDHDTPELQLLQRVRDEAHRFAITHHRSRRDQQMTQSILDELPGVGPARKRALLKHFGSPDAVIAASRDELESVPGIPGKVARELYGRLNKVVTPS